MAWRALRLRPWITVLILAELGVVAARDAASSLYGLANSAGKARAARDGSLRETKELARACPIDRRIPTETKLSEKKDRRERAGQLAEMLDIR